MKISKSEVAVRTMEESRSDVVQDIKAEELSYSERQRAAKFLAEDITEGKIVKGYTATADCSESAPRGKGPSIRIHVRGPTGLPAVSLTINRQGRVFIRTLYSGISDSAQPLLDAMHLKGNRYTVVQHQSQAVVEGRKRYWQVRL